MGEDCWFESCLGHVWLSWAPSSGKHRLVPLLYDQFRMFAYNKKNKNINDNTNDSSVMSGSGLAAAEFQKPVEWEGEKVFIILFA